MLNTLRTYFGYTAFRPLQKEIIETVLAHKNVLALMPTGGGKSICYQIPALMMPGMAIVISPLISLMKDQVDALCANGIKAAALNSTNDEVLNREILTRCFHGDVKILYVSPERFVSEQTRLFSRLEISLIAIDEAHCISQWGHDFRPEYTQLHTIRQVFPSTPILALTATADSITRQDILKQLRIENAQVFCTSFDRPNLSLCVYQGLRKQEKLRLIENCILRHRDESGIIYCLSRKSTEEVAEELCKRGISAKAYHAQMANELRTSVQEDFLYDRVQVVCATVAFGMGIDKSNIRFVIHYNLPKTIENYYQEIGRGGRDGLPCETILFYGVQDIVTLRHFADEAGQRELNLDKLRKIQQYAEIQTCRRQYILNYFGERFETKCGNCDCCKRELKKEIGEEKIVGQSLVSRSKRVISTVVTQGVDEEVDQELLRQLKALRLEFANQENVPAFVIFSDKTIHDIALRKPVTLEELKECHGIGNFKAEKYGDAILRLARKCHVIPPEKPQESRNYMAKQKQLHASAYAPWTPEDDQLLLMLARRGNTIAEMMAIFHRNEGAIRSRLKKLK